MTTRPLNGIRVLAFEQYGAGPFGTQYLADLGAEVIKIEPAGTEGDYARSLGPHFVGDDPEDTSASLFFQAFNRNKKSVTLDITTSAGREVLGRLVAGADATADNLRGDVPEKLGLTYDALKGLNPRIVCAHCSGYGRTGPRRDWPGYDYLMQAEAGYLHLCGEPDSIPARFGLSIVDYMGGLSMALGLVSAVLDARKEGGTGRDIDISLFDTAIYNLSYLGVWALNSGYVPGRAARSAHPSLVPCQMFGTRDGWVYLMCNKEVFWSRLCRLMGRDGLIADSRFATFADRNRNKEALIAILDDEFRRKTSADWLSELGGQVPIAPVLEPREALASAYFAQTANLRTVGHDSGAMLHTLASPIRFGVIPDDDHAGPALGAHTDEILKGIGYSSREIRELRRSGIL